MRKTVSQADTAGAVRLDSRALQAAMRKITLMERQIDYAIMVINHYREEYGQKPIDRERFKNG